MYKKSELPANGVVETKYDDLRIFCNYRRLRFTRRFNNLPTVQTEDVAQHSFYVTMLAMTMAEEYNNAVQTHNLQVHPYDVDNVWDKVNVEQVMRQALFHDIEESFTSDIPWNVKHHSDSVNTAIKHATGEKMRSIYSRCSSTLHTHLALNAIAKMGLEGKFVAIADMMECAWNCHQEERMGNKYLHGMKIKAVNEIDNMDFSKVLYETSPLFHSMMRMFNDDLTYVASDTMELE